MQPFTTLTPRGQALRLRQMAAAALDHYDLAPRRIRLVANHLNCIFRVDTHDRQTYALRISHPTWRTRDDLRGELLWLAALGRDTDIGAPEPLASRTGDMVTTVAVEGVPEPRRCVVMSWIPGRLLIEHLTEDYLEQLGVLAARLHEHAPHVVLPPDLKLRTMSSIYARDEPDVLFAATSAEWFTRDSRMVFERVREQVQAVFAQLYALPTGRRMIHNDLHQENVKVAHGRLRPLDFEDVLWGYPVQDIAMTYADLLLYTQTSQTAYQQLCRAFQRGYTSHCPWPEAEPGQIDTFIAGRQLWRANYVARFESQFAREFNTRLAGQFQLFLDSGTMQK
jgi:Ser/Thr protein kinase RdoA (MazF antagonist)